MKKRIIILGIIIAIVATSVWVGLKFYKKKIITFETVKIVSYKLTKNGHVLGESLASGTIISKDGLVLTNHHVVTDKNEENYDGFAICVVNNKEEEPSCVNTASLIAKNESLDIALLKVNNTDIFGDKVKNFDYLDYKGKGIEMDEKVNVVGFPVIGGKTITSTQGQISGYEEKEGTKFLKIDAKIDQGNSGGTVKDEKGNFVGIPSFLKSNYDTLGYIIPLDAVQSFINENEEKEVDKDEFTINLLNSFLQKKYDAEKNRIYQSSFYPYFEIKLSDNWKVESVNAEGFSISQIINGKDLKLDLKMGRGGKNIPNEFLNINLEKFEKEKHKLNNYKRDDKEFRGFKGYEMSFESGGKKIVTFLGIRENVVLTYNYSYSNEIKEVSDEEVTNLFDSLQELDKANDTELDKKIGKNEKPRAEIETFDNFNISYVDNNQDKDMIFAIESDDSLEMRFYVYETFLPKDFWNMPEEEVFENRLQGLSKSFAISDKYTNLQINGLRGFGYTFSYVLNDINKPHKATQIFLFKNNKEIIEIIYDDLADNYDKNLETFIKTIKTFKYEGREGETILPQFKSKYNDLKNYVYENEISSLINHNILDLEGDSFFPEENITSKEVLFTVLKSKVFIEKGRNSTQTLDALKTEGFFDYAERMDFIDDSFSENSSIKLDEALKIMCKVYQLPIWDPPYKIDENLPYFYKWNRMKASVSAGQKETLTRGQFAAVLYYFIQSAGDRQNF